MIQQNKTAQNIIHKSLVDMNIASDILFLTHVPHLHCRNETEVHVKRTTAMFQSIMWPATIVQTSSQSNIQY
jgi:hypothetical protein